VNIIANYLQVPGTNQKWIRKFETVETSPISSDMTPAHRPLSPLVKLQLTVNQALLTKNQQNCDIDEVCLSQHQWPKASQYNKFLPVHRVILGCVM
jgi:hypothetical protein